MKGKLNKNLVIGILLFFVFSSGQGQEIIGKFCNIETPYGTSVCYNFKKDGTFNYRSAGDLPPDLVGAGEYQIENNWLKLSYKTNHSKELSFYKRTVSNSTGDSVKVSVQVLDFDGKPILNAFCFYRKDDPNSSSERKQVNKNGKVEFFLSKVDKPVFFEVKHIQHQNLLFSLPQLSTNNTITVSLADIMTELPIEEKKDSLRILESKDGFLTLEDTQGKISKWNHE